MLFAIPTTFIQVPALEAGKIIWAKDWKLEDVQIKAHDELILEHNENVDMP